MKCKKEPATFTMAKLLFRCWIYSMEARGVEPLAEDNDNTSFYGCNDRFDVT